MQNCRQFVRQVALFPRLGILQTFNKGIQRIIALVQLALQAVRRTLQQAVHVCQQVFILRAHAFAGNLKQPVF